MDGAWCSGQPRAPRRSRRRCSHCMSAWPRPASSSSAPARPRANPGAFAMDPHFHALIPQPTSSSPARACDLWPVDQGGMLSNWKTAPHATSGHPEAQTRVLPLCRAQAGAGLARAGHTRSTWASYVDSLAGLLRPEDGGTPSTGTSTTALGVEWCWPSRAIHAQQDRPGLARRSPDGVGPPRDAGSLYQHPDPGPSPRASSPAAARVLRRTRRSGTRPEMALRSALNRRGLRFVIDRPVAGCNRRRRVVRIWEHEDAVGAAQEIEVLVRSCPARLQLRAFGRSRWGS